VKPLDHVSAARSGVGRETLVSPFPAPRKVDEKARTPPCPRVMLYGKCARAHGVNALGGPRPKKRGALLARQPWATATDTGLRQSQRCRHVEPCAAHASHTRACVIANSIVFSPMESKAESRWGGCWRIVTQGHGESFDKKTSDPGVAVVLIILCFLFFFFDA